VAQTYKVDIAKMTYSPQSITIATGDTVEWTNQMGMTHTVTPDNDEFPGSGPIAPNGGTFSHTFDAAGTISYHCEIHPFMTGTLVIA
jgi:plastocyanin